MAHAGRFLERVRDGWSGSRRYGCLALDVRAWMKDATGALVGPEALLAATERALAAVK
jgi:hypothetical protein